MPTSHGFSAVALAPAQLGVPDGDAPYLDSVSSQTRLTLSADRTSSCLRDVLVHARALCELLRPPRGSCFPVRLSPFTDFS